MVWMPPGSSSGVIELKHNSGGNWHYHNMAHWLGHPYEAVASGGKEADVAALSVALVKMMDRLA